MSKRRITVTILLFIIILFTIGRCRRSKETAVARIERGSIEVWSTYIGTIESQNVRNISHHIHGSATITEIIPDGTCVTQGMPIARFDASRWEDDMVEASKNLLLARADYESLINAKLPLEIRELESKLMTSEQKLGDEKQALQDTTELFEDNLVPEYEVKQLEIKVKNMKIEIDGLKETIELTKRYLHPAARKRAQASLDSASNAYVNIQQRIEDSILRAPCSGIAVHKPTNVSGDYRVPRVGDTIWQSQVFMTISDMSDLVARCDVTESELTRITPGATAIVTPIAYPELKLNATVMTVGAMAQVKPGRSYGAKFFQVVLKVESADNKTIRSDMSAEVRILSHQAENVLLIPRTAVWWENGEPYCEISKFGESEKRHLKLGFADESNFVLIDGLEPEQKVVIK